MNQVSAALARALEVQNEILSQSRIQADKEAEREAETRAKQASQVQAPSGKNPLFDAVFKSISNMPSLTQYQVVVAYRAITMVPDKVDAFLGLPESCRTVFVQEELRDKGLLK